jgi:hypothetical protein
MNDYWNAPYPATNSRTATATGRIRWSQDAASPVPAARRQNTRLRSQVQRKIARSHIHGESRPHAGNEGHATRRRTARGRLSISGYSAIVAMTTHNRNEYVE